MMKFFVNFSNFINEWALVLDNAFAEASAVREHQPSVRCDAGTQPVKGQ